MTGRLEVITGPMFSGKTEELIRRLRRDEIGGKSVFLVRPMIDDRYGPDELVAHSGASFPAQRVNLLAQWPMYTNGKTPDVLGVDEAQFFDEYLIRDIQHAIDRGRKVVVTGLDMTYRREPFSVMPTLMAIADQVDKLSAVCHKCGEDAIFTQRLVNGKPAPFTGPTVQVGGLDSYEARCRSCFEIG